MPSRVSRISQSFACNAARLKLQRISHEYRATDAAHYHRNGTTSSHGQYFTVTKCVQLAGIRAPVPDVFGGPRTEFRPQVSGAACAWRCGRCRGVGPLHQRRMDGTTSAVLSAGASAAAGTNHRLFGRLLVWSASDVAVRAVRRCHLSAATRSGLHFMPPRTARRALALGRALASPATRRPRY
jgi:hypothetical protein